MNEAKRNKANIAVIGAGLMGHGIAQVFAVSGHEVQVYDPSPSSLATLRARISANLRDLGEEERAADLVHPNDSLSKTVQDADFIVEAVFEDLALKQKLFAGIEASAKSDAILASNTSVIPITSIMRGLCNRTRAIGSHWWNPPFLVPLVEITSTEWTSAATVDATMALHIAAGKMPVHVKKDVPGFIGNRLQHALWREAISLVEQGICDASTVDAVVKSSFGPRLAVLGPLENADLVGTDLTLAIHRLVLPAIESRPGPSPVLEELVESGKLGMKSGEGFQSWTPARQAELRRKIVDHLKAARARVPGGQREP